MGRSDEELVEACQAGESSAFDILVARWEDRIRGAAYRFLGSEDEARDVAQEAFLRAYRAVGGFKREARFSSWLYQIATNLCRDRLRRRKARMTVSLEELEEAGRTMVEPRPGAHEWLQQEELARAVRRAVRSLSEEQREVVILKEYQGLTFLEIAQALDVPVSTVKTRLYRGLGQLRLRLAREGARGAAPMPAVVPWT
jgi:RNA polymerase sigma-70 factor, ECF subfamily